MALMVTGISLPRDGRLFEIAIVADMRGSVIPVFAVLACLTLPGLAATPALAHPPPLGLTGFTGGALHPLFVIDHVLAVLAVGLLMGSQPRWRWLPAISFVLGIAAGIAVMVSGAAPLYANETILGIAVLSGVLVALAWPLSIRIGIALAGVLGIAIVLDSPPETLSIREANQTLAGTAFGATVFLIAVRQAAQYARPLWARIAVRAAGSWIAAAAILALALRFVRPD
jgi:hydrogenase/urease accessory protein HupE